MSDENIKTLIITLPAVLIALGGLVAIWGDLKAKTLDIGRRLDSLHSTINSQQTTNDLLRANEAREKQSIAVQLATLAAQKEAASQAQDIERTTSVSGRTDAETILFLRAQVARLSGITVKEVVDRSLNTKEVDHE